MILVVEKAREALNVPSSLDRDSKKIKKSQMSQKSSDNVNPTGRVRLQVPVEKHLKHPAYL